MEHKKRIQGTVTSTKNSKTIKVETITYVRHPLYKKRVEKKHVYYAHDEKNEAKNGDTVTIVACRPMSATKRFTLVSIDKRAIETIKVEEENEVKEVLHEEEKVEEETK